MGLKLDKYEVSGPATGNGVEMVFSDKAPPADGSSELIMLTVAPTLGEWADGSKQKLFVYDGSTVAMKKVTPNIRKLNGSVMAYYLPGWRAL